tara:strand:- start:2197 stop:2391 length:195 start_codon:yes stop_codon:yes gene_type:complete
MKKYTLRIIYNDDTDVVEKVEETVTDLDSVPKVLSIGENDILDHLTIEEWTELNNSFNGEIIHA